jgi:hypothetical protein
MNEDMTVLPEKQVVAPRDTPNHDLSKVSSSNLTEASIGIFGDDGSPEGICDCRILGELDKFLNILLNLKTTCRVGRVVIQLANLIGRQIARDEFQRIARPSTEAGEP